ncbi:uncharacterized protein [Coffea arabica]|uniref:Uncharacterized protein n=1 Tax=Coffea arabica TaxID=13443 RepID=A0ABM4WCG1_COFAR
MSVEIHGGASAEPLQFGGITKQIFERSRTKYTRAFLLSLAELDVCKELPSGLQLEPLLLRQLKDAPSSTPESWRIPGALSINSSGNSKGGSLQSIKQDTSGNNLSDFRRQRDLLQCPPKARGCEAGILSQNIQETPNEDIYQLRKSENPYRPPHCHKTGSNNFEAKSTSQEIHSTSQNETLPKVRTISSDEDHNIKIFSAPLSSSNSVDLNLAKDTSSDSVNVATPSQSCNSLEAFIAYEAENGEFDSHKKIISMNSRESSGVHCRMTMREHVGNSSKVDNSCSSNVIENAMPQHPAACLGSGIRHMGNLCASTIERLGCMPKNASESNSVISEMTKDHESTSDLEPNEVCSTRLSNSGQIRSVDWVTSTDLTEPCELSFLHAYDVITSSSSDSILTRPHQKSTVAGDVLEEPELYEMDANESSFEDFWSEILATIQFEQEMDLNTVAEYGQTADSEVQMCLPDDSTLISIAYSSCCKLSKGINSEDSADSADDIHLPDENNLISMDDLIAPHCLRLIGDQNSVEGTILWSNPTDKVAKEHEGLDIACEVKSSALEDSTLNPFQDVKTSLTPQEFPSQQSYLQNPFNGINAEIPSLHPLDSQKAQMGFQMSLMNPMALHPYSPLNCHSCTDMHQRYSVLHQPSVLPQQYHELQINVAPIDPPPIAEVACYNWGLDRIQISPLAYQQTTYPDFPLPDLAPFLDPSGLGRFNRQSALHRFIDMGRGSRHTRKSASAWDIKKPPRKH